MVRSDVTVVGVTCEVRIVRPHAQLCVVMFRFNLSYSALLVVDVFCSELFYFIMLSPVVLYFMVRRAILL